MSTIKLSDLPTTQFTAAALAKQLGLPAAEVRDDLDRKVAGGFLKVKVASSRARNYSLVKAAKTAGPRKSAPRKTTAATHPDGSQEQYDAAKVEQKALKAWESKGGKGKRPATPNYDAIKDKYAAKQANGGRAPRKARTRKTGETSTPRGTTVRFVIDGKPMPDSQNKLSSVAWYHTAGVCGDDSPRCSVTELRAILADCKPPIVDPSNEVGWEVELSNGKTVSTVAL